MVLEPPCDVPTTKKIGVLMSHSGQDGSSRSAFTISRALWDGRMEIVYGGSLECEQVVEAAIQEDVDIVYLNDESRARLDYYEQVVQLFESRGLANQVIVLTNEINFIAYFAQIIINLKRHEPESKKIQENDIFI